MKFHLAHQPYRKKPFVARWYENGRSQNRFFATEEARDAFLADFASQRQRQDPTLPALAPHQLIRWQQAMQLAPEADPVEVVRFWLTANREKRRHADKPLSVAADEYVKSMELVGRNRSYIGHVRRALADLIDELEDPTVREVTPDLLREHLFGLPYGPITLRNRRAYLLGSFGWWEQQGWIEANPMKKVESPKVRDKEPGILTVAETRALFEANEKTDPEVCGLLALGAFAGLRTSAIARLDFKEIDFAQRGILTPAEKTKKGRRQWIEDLPDNLWAWLRRTPPTAFAMDHRHMLHRRSQAFKRAGLLVEADDIAATNARREAKGLDRLDLKPKCPPKNALRHSFVTYHVALHRNPGKTALIISHRDQDCLYRHYLGIGNQKAAAEYFEIRPT